MEESKNTEALSLTGQVFDMMENEDE